MSAPRQTDGTQCGRRGRTGAPPEPASLFLRGGAAGACSAQVRPRPRVPARPPSPRSLAHHREPKAGPRTQTRDPHDSVVTSPEVGTLTWMPSVRSARGRAPPRANSISGCSAARPLRLLSRRAPPRPALSGTRPGYAPAWVLPLGRPCRMALLPSIKDVVPGGVGGRLSVLPIKLAPLGWGRARTSPYVTAPRTSCQSKKLQSLGRLGRKQTGTRPAIGRGVCQSPWIPAQRFMRQPL